MAISQIMSPRNSGQQGRIADELDMDLCYSLTQGVVTFWEPRQWESKTTCTVHGCMCIVHIYAWILSSARAHRRDRDLWNRTTGIEVIPPSLGIIASSVVDTDNSVLSTGSACWFFPPCTNWVRTIIQCSPLSKHASVYSLHITHGMVSFYKDITRKHRELSINSMHVDFALLIGRERNSWKCIMWYGLANRCRTQHLFVP